MATERKYQNRVPISSRSPLYALMVGVSVVFLLLSYYRRLWEERRKKNATGETVTDASGKMDAKDETDLHCFDILAGTGSGGFLALIVARLRLPVDKITDTYGTLFNILSSAPPNMWAWLRKYIYSETESEMDLLQEVRKYDDPDALFYDNRKDAMPVLIIDSNGKGKPEILRSDDPKEEITVVGAMQATFASAHNLDSGNPTMLLIEEAMKKYGYYIQFSPLLSVGTGVPEEPGLLAWLTSLFWDARNVHDKVTDFFEIFGTGTYVRINVPHIGHLKPDDHEAVEEIIRKTKNHLNSDEGKRLIRAVVEALKPENAAENMPFSSPSYHRWLEATQNVHRDVQHL